jgi:hypothetical protein
VCVGVLVSPAAACAAEGQPFGIESFSVQTTGPAQEVRTELPSGATLRRFVNEPVSFTQAGGHPYALTTTIALLSEPGQSEGFGGLVPTRDPKDLVVDLPAGLLAIRKHCQGAHRSRC